MCYSYFTVFPNSFRCLLSVRLQFELFCKTGGQEKNQKSVKTLLLKSFVKFPMFIENEAVQLNQKWINETVWKKMYLTPSKITMKQNYKQYALKLLDSRETIQSTLNLLGANRAHVGRKSNHLQRTFFFLPGKKILNAQWFWERHNVVSVFPKWIVKGEVS